VVADIVLAPPARRKEGVERHDEINGPCPGGRFAARCGHFFAGVASRPATESLHGIVGSVDQGHDTIEIRLSPDKTEQFRVQDGLVFNSVRYGDQVEITVESIEGAKTIVGLRKE
jgi:hypothetical protein